MKDFNDIERNDDLSQFFRNSADNLEAEPSYTAWDKLERKLDSRRLRKRAVIYRYTSMVAAVVGIVSLFMVFKLLNKVENLDKISNNEPFAQLEEAPLTEDEFRIAQAIEQHKNEAEQVKEIREKFPIAPTENVSDFEEESEDVPSEPIADNIANSKPKFKIPEAQKVPASRKALAKREEVEEVESFDYRRDEEKKLEEISEEKEEEVTADYLVVMPEKPTKGDVLLNSSGNPVSSKDDKRAKTTVTSRQKADNEKVVEVKQERVNLNTIPANVESDVKEVATYNSQGNGKKKQSKSKKTIAQFNWMAGKWKDALKADSYENWFVDETEIVGEGYVLVDGKKEFTEYMRIYQSGKNIYFASSIDETKKIRKFKLKSYEGNQAVFERKSRKFPNKVTITKVSNGAFRITYMNKNDDNITESQAKYFNTRNNISVERASRNLNKY
jgi:hypothetical protein